MGLILAKFRKTKSNTEKLDKLNGEIKSIESYSKDTDQRHKRIVGQFLVLSIGLYISVTLIFFFYFFPPTFREQVLYIVPICLVPVIILCTKKVLSWFYTRKITKNQNKLYELRKEKKKILNQVMETETYKVARELLEKYAPDMVTDSNTTTKISNELTPVQRASADLRRRTLTANRNLQFPSRNVIVNSGPMRSPPASQQLLVPSNNQIVPQNSNNKLAVLPYSILPRNKSILDRLIDYIVGDGHSNRFALICNNCAGHNGMVLEEQHCYTEFKCCYCFSYNPALRKRPAPPKLEFETDIDSSLRPNTASSGSSGSDKDSGSDSEPDVKVPELEPTPPKELESDAEKHSDTERARFDSDTDTDTATNKNSESEPRT